MLISRRKEGEILLIGDDIEVRIVSIRKNKVILGVIAPRNVKLATSKLTDVEMANTMAAVNSANIDRFLHAPPGDAEHAVLLLAEIPSKKAKNDR